MSDVPPVPHPPPERPPRVRLAKGQEVSLGCGTLILIGLLIFFLTQPRLRDLDHDLRGLRSDISELKRAVEDQTEQIKKLQEALKKDRP